MSGLPREVLKWAQALDLSYSLKNPKRDFSNGFLVAEIVSRYWKGVPMHSIDNGTAIPKKRDNWETLQKIFRHKGIHFSKELIDGVILCKEDCAAELVGQLYMTLTARKLQQLPAIEAPEAANIPAFQRPNATALMRDITNSAKTDQIMGDLDVKVKETRANDVLKTHAESIQKEKAADPARFKPKAVRKMASMQPEDDESEANPASAVNFKEVTVRSIDTAMALRTLRTQQANASRSDLGLTGGYTDGGTPLSGGRPDGTLSTVGGERLGLTGGLTVREVLSREVWRVLGEASRDGSGDDGPKGRAVAFFWFVEHLRGGGGVDLDVRQAVWDGLLNKAKAIAAAVVEAPSELSVFATALAKIWGAPDGGDRKQAAMLLCCVGDEVAKEAPALARETFTAYLLHPLLSNPGFPAFDPASVETVMRVGTHWADAYDKTEYRSLLAGLAVPRLPGSIPTSPHASCSVLLTLALVRVEPSPFKSAMKDAEIAGCVFKRVFASLSDPDPTVRAAGLCLCAEAVAAGVVLPKEVEGQVSSVAECSGLSMEEKMAVLTVAAAMLEQASAGGDLEEETPLADREQEQLATKLAASVMARRLPVNARVFAASLFARFVSTANAVLARIYVATLASLPPPSLSDQLAPRPGTQTVTLPSRVLPGYPVSPAATTWDAAAVAFFAAELLAKSRSDATGTGSAASKLAVLQIIHAAVASNVSPPGSGDSLETWWQALQMASEELSSPQPSPEAEELVSGIVRLFFLTISNDPSIPHAEEAELMSKAKHWFMSVDFSSLP
ncbi:hypothetical protein DIPPA_16375 [Diplonema papillatum]|nr:hypothetical protein DIPPA_16375 [Diplonema papillatum]